MAGKPGTDNVGIVSFNAVRYAGDFDANETRRQRLPAQVGVRNYRATPLTPRDGVTLRLDVLVEDKLAHVEQKTLVINERRPRKEDAGEDGDEPGEENINFVLPPLDLR